MADYAAKPTRAKEDAGIIDLRKRMLGVFLNRCRRMREVVEDGVWWRFLDPNSSWVCWAALWPSGLLSGTDANDRTRSCTLTQSLLSLRTA